MAIYAGRIFSQHKDGAIGDPIEDAKIVFRGAAGRASTVSAADGRYRVELPLGTYMVTASASGFASKRSKSILRRKLQTLNLFLNAKAQSDRTGIHGRVFERQEDGTAGEPLSQVSIAATRIGTAASTKTNKKGQYSLALAPGTYLVDARTANHGPTRSRVVVADGMRVVNFFITAKSAGSHKASPHACTRISDTDGVERTSDVLVPGGEIVEMTYRVVDGQAWLDGGIGLGSVKKLDAEVARARRTPKPDEDIAGAGSRTISQALVAMSSGDKLWEQGLVPFQFDESNATLRARVREAIDHIEANTNIVFLPASDNFADRVVIQFSTDPDSSSAQLGRQGGTQNIWLNEDFDVGGIIHELLHSVGVFHEQARNDRDAFITVNMDNVKPGRRHNFRKAVFRGGADIGPYDFASVMHYGAQAFGRDANFEIRFLGPDASTIRYDLLSHPGVEDLDDGWRQVVIPLSDFASSLATSDGFHLSYPDEQVEQFSFLLADIGFATTASGAIAQQDFVIAPDPNVTAGLAPPAISDAGSAASIDTNFTDDRTFSPAVEVVSGEGSGTDEHVALIEFSGYPSGFAESFTHIAFKVRIDVNALESNTNLITMRPVDPAIPTAALGNSPRRAPFMSPGDIAGLKALYPARIDFDGGHLWGANTFVTDIAMGDIDGDGRDEMVVTRKASGNSRYFILDDTREEYETLIRGGNNWGKDHYATCCAIGDVDGDGIDEIIIGRKADANHRFRVVKMNAGLSREIELFRGGENWGRDSYVTDVAIGVDGAGQPLIGVARKAGSNSRFMIFSGADDDFRLLFRGGVDWGASNYATSIAFGDVDGDGRLEIGVARKAAKNSRWLIYKDVAGDYTDFRPIHSGGVNWGEENYATAIAFGDVDGDGRDEVAVARKASGNSRFFVHDDFSHQFRLLKSGGERWGKDAFATSVALGDVDGDGRAELAVCRQSGTNARVFLYDDNDANYQPLWDNGRRWGKDNDATCVALGNSLRTGRARHIAVGRKASANHRFSVTDYNP
ncbi:MAG: M12 family metallopeptidase [Gammaproteobacteria bacterium]